jgi:hypothetical protein
MKRGEVMTYWIVVSIVYFFVLYLIAFFSNLHYREEDDILFIHKSQWKAILVMWLPILVGIFSERK